MKVEIVKFKASHGMKLMEKGALTYLAPYIKEDTFQNLESKCAFSAVKEKRILYCGGLIEWNVGRGEAWGFFDRNVGADFISVHRAAVRLLQVCGYRRVEAVVDCDFKPGHRWVSMMGFKLEAARMKAYAIDGRDMSLYALVKENF